MATVQRWQRAQAYERSFWANLAASIEAGAIKQLDWYEWKAREVQRRLAEFLGEDAPANGRVLEIGSGPIGVANCLPWDERVAIDPLEAFYRQRPTLTRLRRPDTRYVEGAGEALPFPDGAFDLVIIDNVIDHTRSPHSILREIQRVLADRGVLYFAVNVHTAWGAAMHGLLAALRIDEGHPYTFTRGRARGLLIEHGFLIRGEEVEDYKELKRRHLRSSNVRDKLKAVSGILEFQYTAVCTKRAAVRDE